MADIQTPQFTPAPAIIPMANPIEDQIRAISMSAGQASSLPEHMITEPQIIDAAARERRRRAQLEAEKAIPAIKAKLKQDITASTQQELSKLEEAEKAGILDPKIRKILDKDPKIEDVAQIIGLTGIRKGLDFLAGGPGQQQITKYLLDRQIMKQSVQLAELKRTRDLGTIRDALSVDPQFSQGIKPTPDQFRPGLRPAPEGRTPFPPLQISDPQAGDILDPNAPLTPAQANILQARTKGQGSIGPTAAQLKFSQTMREERALMEEGIAANPNEAILFAKAGYGQVEVDKTKRFRQALELDKELTEFQKRQKLKQHIDKEIRAKALEHEENIEQAQNNIARIKAVRGTIPDQERIKLEQAQASLDSTKNLMEFRKGQLEFGKVKNEALEARVQSQQAEIALERQFNKIRLELSVSGLSSETIDEEMLRLRNMLDRQREAVRTERNIFQRAFGIGDEFEIIPTEEAEKLPPERRLGTSPSGLDEGLLNDQAKEIQRKIDAIEKEISETPAQ